MHFTFQKALIALSFTLSLFGAAIVPILTHDRAIAEDYCPCTVDSSNPPQHETAEPTAIPSGDPPEGNPNSEPPTNGNEPGCPCPLEPEDHQPIPPVWDPPIGNASPIDIDPDIPPACQLPFLSSCRDLQYR